MRRDVALIDRGRACAARERSKGELQGRGARDGYAVETSGEEMKNELGGRRNDTGAKERKPRNFLFGKANRTEPQGGGQVGGWVAWDAMQPRMRGTHARMVDGYACI